MTMQRLADEAISLEARPERLQTLILQIGGLVGHAMEQLVAALSQQDGECSKPVAVADTELEDLQCEVRELCVSQLLSAAPTAPDDLRWVIRMEQVAAEFRRMGHHCLRVATITGDLALLPAVPPTTDLSALVSTCATQVSDILSALASQDHERVYRARLVALNDTRVHRRCRRVFENLKSERSGAGRPETLLRLAAGHIDRVAEHVRNVAEQLVDAETGVVEALC